MRSKGILVVAYTLLKTTITNKKRGVTSVKTK